MMKKDLNQVNKNENEYSNISDADEHLQNGDKSTSDKISENRKIGGLSDRDDAPASGIRINDPTEHTLGNP